MEQKVKHLELIQGVVNRMAANSFLLKGLSVTLVAALFALAAKDANVKYVIIAYFPVVVFWLLDGYYLWQERLFRALYNEVRQREERTIDFSMHTHHLVSGRNTWTRCVFSGTLGIFYASLIVTMLIVMFLIK